MKRKIFWILVVSGIFCFLISGHLFYYQKSKITIYDGNICWKVAAIKGLSVGELLKKNNFNLAKDDLTNPATNFIVTPGSKIYISRSHSELIVSTITLKPELIEQKKEESNLRPVLLKKYRYGKKIIQQRIFSRNQKIIRKEKIAEKITYSYFTTITLLGRKTLRPLKTYNLSRCRKIKMIATAYYPGDPLAWKDGTETRLGMKMERGIVAVDPRVIKLRSRIYIPGYGYGYTADTGSAIKGLRIDLGVNNAAEEKDWMHQPVTVYILEQAKDY